MTYTFNYKLTKEDAPLISDEHTVSVEYGITNGVAIMTSISMLPALLVFVKKSVLYDNLQKAANNNALNNKTAALTAA